MDTPIKLLPSSSLSWLNTILAITTISAISFVAHLLWRPSLPPKAPHLIHGYPLIGCLDFFWKRREFLNQKKTESPNGQFSFFYGPLPIVALSGPDARSSFFMTRGLDLNEGFNGLLGQGPDSSDFTRGEEMITYIARTFRVLMARERLSASLPNMVSDVTESLRELPMTDSNTVVIHPFEIYSGLVYRLTHRIVGSNTIADNPKRLADTRAAYHRIEFGSAVEIMFPSLPTPSKVRRNRAMMKLQDALVGEVRERRQAGVKADDAMQVLIDRGDPEVAISSFIIGALLAGVINAGVTAAWTLWHLASDSDWQKEVLSEIDAAVRKHRSSTEQTPTDTLSRLSLEEWESDFPLLSLCLRETIRVHVSGSAMRKNLSGKELPIGKTGNVIPRDAYAIYNLDDVHLDGNVYTDPSKWDPTRYASARAEDKKVDHGFLGWGSGLHPCLGTRFAKLEMTIAIVMLMVGYTFAPYKEEGEANREGEASGSSKRKAPTRKPKIDLRVVGELRG